MCVHEIEIESCKTATAAELDLCECFTLIKKIQKLRDDLAGRKSNLQIRKIDKKKKMKTYSIDIARNDYL